MSLWEFALRTWEDARVRPALLALQEEADQCVPLLLWSLWTTEEGFAVDAEVLSSAAEAARPLHMATIELRSARRRLKALEVKPGLLAMIESATVMAERALLDQLESLTPAVIDPAPPTLEERFRAVTDAWGLAVKPHLISGLMSALAHEPARDEPSQDNDPELAQLRGLLATLKEEHAKLSIAVEMLERAPLPDQLQIARMKRRKLVLRDEIVTIENRLTPDIIA